MSSRLALSGARLRGADAYHAGIATHFTDSPFEDFSLGLMQSLSDLRLSKDTYIQTMLECITEPPAERTWLRDHLALINGVFERDSAACLAF